MVTKKKNIVDNTFYRIKRNMPKISSLKYFIATTAIILIYTTAFADDAKSVNKTPKQQTYDVKSKSMPVIYKATGTVESNSEANISPRITARIIDIYVRSGDHVKKNQMLIKLEDSELHTSILEIESRIDSISAGVSSASNAVQSTEAAYDLAKAEKERNDRLYSGKAISQKIYEQTISKFKQALAELSRSQQYVQSLIAEKKALEQALERSKILFTYSEIKSPINGIIGERSVDPGDLAIPGKIMMTIFDPSKLMLEIPVRESLISKIKLGEKIKFEVKALNKTYDGDIKEIVPYVETKTRTFLVKVSIKGSANLIPGMYGVAKIMIGEKNELLIPSKAITTIGQTETVIVKGKDNKTTKNFVRTITSTTPDMRVVISGLKAGDKVVY